MAGRSLSMRAGAGLSAGISLICRPSTSTMPYTALLAGVPLTMASFHTSAVAFEKRKKLKARLKRKANIARRIEIKAVLAQTAPDPVRGYGLNNQQVWLDSPLYKLLLDKEKVWAGTAGVPEGNETPASPPLIANYGLSASATKLLLQKLPAAQAGVEALQSARRAQLAVGTSVEQDNNDTTARIAGQIDAVRRVIDLRNANSRGIRFENTQRIIRSFSRSGGSGDSEVQAAILTMRIHSVADHAQAMPRDVAVKRSLRALVMQRKSVLKHLKQSDLGRYAECLKNIGVEQRAVEGEIDVR